MSSNKRQAPKDSGREQGSKRSRFGTGSLRSRLNVERSPTPNMSGGLGARYTPSGSSSHSMNGDIDNQSVIFDTTEPVDLSEAIQANNRSQISSPIGSRHRGNRRESILPFRAQGRNGLSREESPVEEQSPGTDQNELRRRDINGDLDEDEAFEIASRASMAPGL